MDGELVLFVLQADAALHVECLFQDDTPVVFLTYLNFLVEEHESTEYGPFLRIAVAQFQGTDDVETVLTANEQFTRTGTEDGTLVERAGLQTVAAVEVTDGEGPCAVFLLQGRDVRHTVVCRHPHRLPRILCHGDGIRAEESRLHVEQRLLLRLQVVDYQA